MRLFTRDRDFYKSFFRLFPILAAQNILVLAMSLADNLMLGAYSQTALSGAAAANQLQFLFNQVIMAVGDALVVLGSQYFGRRETRPIKRVGAIAYLSALLLSLVFFLGATVAPRGILSLFTGEAAYLDAGCTYLSLIRFTYPIFAITSVSLALLRSVASVRVAMLSSVGALAVNCSVNYLLIFGKLGAPEMGLRGAAIGTLLARILEMAVVVGYLLLRDKKLRIKPRELLCFDRSLFRDYLKIARPTLIVGAMFGVSTCLQTVILGHLSSDTIAANSAASTIYMILKVAAIGASSASAVVIGAAIGRGSIPRVKEYARTLQMLYLILGILTSITLFCIRLPLLSLYTGLSPEALDLANDFILVLCVTSIGTTYEMPVLCGIVRGGGDASFVLKNDLVSIWGIVLPLSALGAFVFGFHPVLVLFCLNSDQLFKCAAAAIKCNSYTWIKKLAVRKDEAGITEQ